MTSGPFSPALLLAVRRFRIRMPFVPVSRLTSVTHQHLVCVRLASLAEPAQGTFELMR